MCLAHAGQIPPVLGKPGKTMAGTEFWIGPRVTGQYYSLLSLWHAS